MEILIPIAVMLLAVASIINSVLSMKAARRIGEIDAYLRLLETERLRDHGGAIKPGLNCIANSGATYEYTIPEHISEEDFLQQLRRVRRDRRDE